MRKKEENIITLSFVPVREALKEVDQNKEQSVCHLLVPQSRDLPPNDTRHKIVEGKAQKTINQKVLLRHHINN